jgi:hypothetical protein
MTAKKDTTRPTTEPEDEQDVEGNSMLINPGISADLARSHSREIEREARQRAQAKEVKQEKGR